MRGSAVRGLEPSTPTWKIRLGPVMGITPACFVSVQQFRRSRDPIAAEEKRSPVG